MDPKSGITPPQGDAWPVVEIDVEWLRIESFPILSLEAAYAANGSDSFITPATYSLHNDRNKKDAQHGSEMEVGCSSYGLLLHGGNN